MPSRTGHPQPRGGSRRRRAPDPARSHPRGIRPRDMP